MGYSLKSHTDRVSHHPGPLDAQRVAFLLTLRLLVAVVQNYICGVVHPSCQVLDRAFAELVHPEHVVVDVGDAVDVVFKDVDAEGLMELCGLTERTRYGGGGEGEDLLGWKQGCDTQLFLTLLTATTASLPFSLTLQIRESLASAQYRRSLK